MPLSAPTKCHSYTVAQMSADFDATKPAFPVYHVRIYLQQMMFITKVKNNDSSLTILTE